MIKLRISGAAFCAAGGHMRPADRVFDTPAVTHHDFYDISESVLFNSMFFFQQITLLSSLWQS
jgi:hypothetical protein